MSVNLSPLAGAGWQFFDSNGVPLSGGLLYSYAAGTTTPQATYTTSAGNIANANPIVLDAAGRTASEVWLTQGVAYKFVLKDATFVQIGSYDNLLGINDVTAQIAAIYAAFAASSGSSLVGYIQGSTGSVARTVQSKLSDTISVFDFMNTAQIANVAAGTGDVTSAIQAAFNAYSNAAGTGVFVDVFFPIGTYCVTAELVPNGCNIVGESFDSTIKATAAIRSVIKMRGSQSRIENITVDGNSLANNGIYVGDDVNSFGTNSGLISGCRVQNCKYDGVLFSTYGNHNNFVVDRSLIWLNGTTYNTGTAAASASGTVATITGAADLTTFVRPMYDYVHVGGETLPRAIISVTATTLTVNPVFDNTVTSAAYSIHQGSGVCIMSQGDNSEIKIQNSVMNTNKLAGLDDHALYGAESDNNIIEGNSIYGRIIGRGGSSPHYTISSGDFRNYYEGNSFADIRFEYGINPCIDITGETSLALISFNTSVNGIASGLKYTGNGENFDTNLYTQYNVASFSASWGNAYQLAQGSGIGNVTVNLPVSASTLETQFRTLMLSKITLLIYDINGQNVYVKSASNNVNGVLGTTGITITGNYKKIECVFNGTQWIVG